MPITTKVMLISFFTNLILSFIKIVSGLLGSSQALIADGIHSLSDLITDIVAILGGTLARKPADQKHPYGHGKLEYLTSMIIGFLILILGFGIIYNSFGERADIPSILVMIVSVFTIFAKYILAHYLVCQGKKYDNSILIASGKESSTDVYSSIVVLISIFIMQFSSVHFLFGYADIIGTIIVGIFIVKVGFDVLKDNISFILGEQETDWQLLTKVKKLILSDEHIKTIDHFVLLKFGICYKLTVEVSMDPDILLRDAHFYVDSIETKIKELPENIEYVTIHINPFKERLEYQLRSATKKDKDILCKYNQKYILEQKYKKAEKDKLLLEIKEEVVHFYDQYQLIEFENKIIGMFRIELQDDKYLLRNFYLDLEYRNLGIGYQIMQRMIEEKKAIKLWILKKNDSAISFYQTLGFHITSEVKNSYLMEV